MLVQILDTYSTIYPGSIVSSIVSEFLGGLPPNEANSIVALAGSITSIGMYFLFFNQYLVDIVGRKLMLAITVFGMGISSLGMFLSVNYIMYISFRFFLNFFFMSDIWLIIINEESETNKRALNSNIILMAGLIGAIIMVMCRFTFITEVNPNWRGMTLFPIILGIDPGLATVGYGVVSKDGQNISLIDYGIISTPAKMPLPKRISIIYRWCFSEM